MDEASREQPTQKEIRCRRLVGNTPKEELLLEHAARRRNLVTGDVGDVVEEVREFEDQFVNVYGNRFLYLCPPNEYGVPKFLPTTLRPTHLPYQELYEYKSCSKFLADFFNYDELHPPDRYPMVIPAPASVLNWQAGDCFDLSIALASLLIGVGYDAYCVSGFAPRFITTRNEARSACPQLDVDIEEAKEEDKQEEDEFVIPKKPPLRSEYLEAKRRAEDADIIRLQEEEMKSDSEDDPSSLPLRESYQKIESTAGVAEDMYLEPTTGRIYSVSRCPYLKIDLIWNHRNLWVNMQVCSASHVQLDLYNSRYFEYVMLDADNPSGEAREGDDAGKINCNGAVPDEERRAEQTAQRFGLKGERPILPPGILDLPSPWSERPDIPREKFHARCYQGEKTIFYHKCKVEQYAPYTQDDGLVQRITLYKDVRRQIPLEIRERFKHRKDKLFERKRRPMQNETVERFLPGRPSTSASNAGGALKEFREISALSRELIFYKSRLDGLVRSVEIIGRKMFEYFEDRDDRLIYHSVTLDPTATRGQKSKDAVSLQDTYPVDSVGEVPIKKMTEKYARNPEVPAEEDIAKISFYLTEQQNSSIYSTGKIRVDYHREPGSLTFRQCMYHYKDGNLNRVPASMPQPTQVRIANAQLGLQAPASVQAHMPDEGVAAAPRSPEDLRANAVPRRRLHRKAPWRTMWARTFTCLLQGSSTPGVESRWAAIDLNRSACSCALPTMTNGPQAARSKMSVADWQ
ncbi:unnamed protein product [Effrenium voratum]|nr:unnamed protein product [Effrenium voratum]